MTYNPSTLATQQSVLQAVTREELHTLLVVSQALEEVAARAIFKGVDLGTWA